MVLLKHFENHYTAASIFTISNNAQEVLVYNSIEIFVCIIFKWHFWHSLYKFPMDFPF